MNDTALEQLLRDRPIPDCDSDFLERIKARARATPQKLTLWSELKQVWYSSLHLKPAHALGTLAVIGFLLGLGFSLLQQDSAQTALANNQGAHLIIHQQGYQL